MSCTGAGGKPPRRAGVLPLADFDRAVHLMPNIGVFYSFRGLTHFATGDSDEAIGDCHRAIALDPNATDAYSTLALLHRESGRPDQAIAAPNKVLTTSPDDTRSLRLRVECHLLRGNYTAVIDDVERLSSQGVDDPGVWFMLGYAYEMGRGDVANAMCYSERFLSGSAARRRANEMVRHAERFIEEWRGRVRQ